MNNVNEPISSGLKDWDDAIGGFVPGQFVIIGGRPAMGKSAFTITLAKKLAIVQNIPLAYFSLEMVSCQIIRRLIVNIFNCVTSALIGFNSFDKADDIEVLAPKVLEGAPLYLDDDPRLSLQKLENKIVKLRENGIRIVIIDYMQLLDGFMEDIELSLSQLKKLAEENEVTIIALSQISKSDMKIMPDGVLDSKASKQIFGDSYTKYADIVSVIHRPEYYQKSVTPYRNINIAEIHFIKNVHCDIKLIKLNFESKFSKFSNLRETHE